ncbi:MAG: hypothetical protein OQK09_14735 [Colwellia sp.]|nr:hypothetical protein [Colwellia sp.]MCW8863583.1 hypothetical protein [Colwellia sp.]MCW9082764.1 hypothetical protein [Colwellia sp.]
MIHSPTPSRPTCGPTLNYMYRGVGHEHSLTGSKDKPAVIHLGGNLYSPNPMKKDGQGNTIVDTSDIEEEFEFVANNNKTAINKFKHYIISIEKGAELTQPQWLEVIPSYLKALGYDDTHKWTACIHNDSRGQCQHVHILTSLISMEPNRSAVKTSMDYEQGWPVMRYFEHKFQLTELASPGTENDWGVEYSKARLKGYGGREACKQKDLAAIIRARIKNLYAERGRPKTIKEFAIGLAERNIRLTATKGEDGKVKGALYQLLDVKGKDGKPTAIISGSKLKATRFTFNRLISNEKMNYKPERDDPYIGLAELPARFNISLRVNKNQLKAVKYFGIRHKQRKGSSYIDLSFCRNKKERDLALLVKVIMDLLSALFSLFQYEVFEYTVFEEIQLKYKYDLNAGNQQLEQQMERELRTVKWAHLTDDDEFDESQLALAS